MGSSFSRKMSSISSIINDKISRISNDGKRESSHFSEAQDRVLENSGVSNDLTKKSNVPGRNLLFEESQEGNEGIIEQTELTDDIEAEVLIGPTTNFIDGEKIGFEATPQPDPDPFTHASYDDHSCENTAAFIEIEQGNDTDILSTEMTDTTHYESEEEWESDESNQRENKLDINVEDIKEKVGEAPQNHANGELKEFADVCEEHSTGNSFSNNSVSPVAAEHSLGNPLTPVLKRCNDEITTIQEYDNREAADQIQVSDVKKSDLIHAQWSIACPTDKERAILGEYDVQERGSQMIQCPLQTQAQVAKVELEKPEAKEKDDLCTELKNAERKILFPKDAATEKHSREDVRSLRMMDRSSYEKTQVRSQSETEMKTTSKSASQKQRHGGSKSKVKMKKQRNPLKTGGKPRKMQRFSGMSSHFKGHKKPRRTKARLHSKKKTTSSCFDLQKFESAKNIPFYKYKIKKVAFTKGTVTTGGRNVFTRSNTARTEDTLMKPIIATFWSSVGSRALGRISSGVDCTGCESKSRMNHAFEIISDLIKDTSHIATAGIIYTYPVWRSQLDWLRNCPLLNLYVDIAEEYRNNEAHTGNVDDNADGEDGNDDRGSDRLMFESDINISGQDDPGNQIQRPLTGDHLAVHMHNMIIPIRGTRNRLLIHDSGPGTIFEGREIIRIGRDYRVMNHMCDNYEVGLYRSTRNVTSETVDSQQQDSTILTMPASRTNVSDIVLPQIKHQNLPKMDTAIVEEGVLKLFLEPFQDVIANLNVAWSKVDILKIMYGLLSALDILHQNEVVHLGINERNVALRDTSDPSSVLLINFHNAQFDSNKLIPMHIDDLPPKYIPPEWWFICDLREYSPRMKSVDSWQVGCLLLKLLFGEDPWELSMIPVRHHDVSEEQFQDLLPGSRQIIQQALAVRSGRRVMDHRLLRLMYGLLEPSPADRMTVEAALGSLRQAT